MNAQLTTLGTLYSGKRYFRRDVEQIDVIFAQDGWGINAGSFFIRNSEWIFARHMGGSTAYKYEVL